METITADAEENDNRFSFRRQQTLRYEQSPRVGDGEIPVACQPEVPSSLSVTEITFEQLLHSREGIVETPAPATAGSSRRWEPTTVWQIIPNSNNIISTPNIKNKIHHGNEKNTQEQRLRLSIQARSYWR